MVACVICLNFNAWPANDMLQRQAGKPKIKGRLTFKIHHRVSSCVSRQYPRPHFAACFFCHRCKSSRPGQHPPIFAFCKTSPDSETPRFVVLCFYFEILYVLYQDILCLSIEHIGNSAKSMFSLICRAAFAATFYEGY